MKYFGNHRTDLQQIHRDDVFIPCSDEFECEGQGSRVTGDKNGFLALLGACVRFVW